MTVCCDTQLSAECACVSAAQAVVGGELFSGIRGQSRTVVRIVIEEL